MEPVFQENMSVMEKVNWILSVFQVSDARIPSNGDLTKLFLIYK